jgi:hypothetical protein
MFNALDCETHQTSILTLICIFLPFPILFTEERLSRASWVEKGRIKKGTHLILSAAHKGGLNAEAITPGPIGSRKTSFIGTVRSHLVARALFDVFLGDEAVDEGAKPRMGNSLLYFANGFRIEGKTPKTQLPASWDDPSKIETPKGEEVWAHPSVFSWIDPTRRRRRMLLGGVATAASVGG